MDGDVDLWFLNRSGPQVRFLRNDFRNPENHFVALRLQGTTCNRDAIGARVEVVTKGQGGKRRIKALRAGEGYLSQSSKWVHFGLGGDSAIEKVIVSWPGGKDEVFTGVAADRRYVLVQGKGKPTHWATKADSKVVVSASGGGVLGGDAAPSAAAEIALSYPVMMPPLADGKGGSLSRFKGSMVLVNLWSPTCPACVVELADLTKNATALRKAGVNVLALLAPIAGLRCDREGGHGVPAEARLPVRFWNRHRGDAEPAPVHRQRSVRSPDRTRTADEFFWSIRAVASRQSIAGRPRRSESSPTSRVSTWHHRNGLR